MLLEDFIKVPPALRQTHDIEDLYQKALYVSFMDLPEMHNHRVNFFSLFLLGAIPNSIKFTNAYF